METDRSNFCGCKGIRTCIKCEEAFGIKVEKYRPVEGAESYVYCHQCQIFWRAWCPESSGHPDHGSGPTLKINGVLLIPDFISIEEEAQLIKDLDELPWDKSQSGRRKQNFGPKCNFKKRRLKLGDFKGFPQKTKFVQEKLKNVEILKGFQTIEQCTLEYDPDCGASIDPHIDDCWIWGERIITVNLLSDTYLTLRPYRGGSDKYNLHCVKQSSDSILEVTVRIPQPRRSLVVLYGDARYRWEHFIPRSDISSRRLALAYREFTPPYLPGGEHFDDGQPILEVAKQFL